MSMKALDELREKFCHELEEIVRKPEMRAGDLETVHKLTDTIKNIDKIGIMDETGGYSQAGDWEAAVHGNYGRRYDRGNSYANRGEHYVRGHYSRANRDHYSRDGGESIIEHVDMMLDETTNEHQRDLIKRFKKQLEDIM